MRSNPRSRFGFARTLFEMVIGTLMALRPHGREARPSMGWKAGAKEFHLPEGLRRKMTATALTSRSASHQSRFMRPLLVFGFLLAFASLGVGFGGFSVDPDAAFAPDTPEPLVIVSASSMATLSESAPAKLAQAPDTTAFGGRITSSSNTRPVNTVAPADTATPVDTATPGATEPTETATLEPTATAVPPTAAPATPVPPTPVPTPAWDYYPVNQLSAADVRAAAASAGWPAELIDAVVDVAWCESSYRPNATNGWAYGMMQMVPNWFDYAGVDFAHWTDPVTNLRVAYAAYQYDISKGNAPWTQWVCRPPATAANVPPQRSLRRQRPRPRLYLVDNRK